MERQMRLSLDQRDQAEEKLWQQRQELYSQIPKENREEMIRLLAPLIARAVRRASSSKEEEPRREDQ